MPRKYKRKRGVVPRHIYWTEDSLTLAFEELNKYKKYQRNIPDLWHILSNLKKTV